MIICQKKTPSGSIANQCWRRKSKVEKNALNVDIIRLESDKNRLAIERESFDMNYIFTHLLQLGLDFVKVNMV